MIACLDCITSFITVRLMRKPSCWSCWRVSTHSSRRSPVSLLSTMKARSACTKILNSVLRTFGSTSLSSTARAKLCVISIKACNRNSEEVVNCEPLPVPRISILPVTARELAWPSVSSTITMPNDDEPAVAKTDSAKAELSSSTAWNENSKSQIRIKSPSLIRVGSVIRRPFRKVPLRLLRSSSRKSLPCTLMQACWRLTEPESSVNSHSGCRPMIIFARSSSYRFPNEEPLIAVR